MRTTATALPPASLPLSGVASEEWQHGLIFSTGDMLGNMCTQGGAEITMKLAKQGSKDALEATHNKVCELRARRAKEQEELERRRLEAREAQEEAKAEAIAKAKEAEEAALVGDGTASRPNAQKLLAAWSLCG